MFSIIVYSPETKNRVSTESIVLHCRPERLNQTLAHRGFWLFAFPAATVGEVDARGFSVGYNLQPHC